MASSLEISCSNCYLEYLRQRTFLHVDFAVALQIRCFTVQSRYRHQSPDGWPSIYRLHYYLATREPHKKWIKFRDCAVEGLLTFYRLTEVAEVLPGTWHVATNPTEDRQESMNEKSPDIIVPLFHLTLLDQ